jgi:hypothetical protein
VLVVDEERERERRWEEDPTALGEVPVPEGDDAAPHDDIMKRLLDYQRSLRGGASPEEAAEAAARAWIAEPAPEPYAEPAPEPYAEPAPERDELTDLVAGAGVPEVLAEGNATQEESDATAQDLHVRLTALEARLDRLGPKVADLRQSFQDLAIAADERLASIENEIAEARRDLSSQ